MQCTSCEFENPEGMKFCGGYGVPLRLRCPRCNGENPLHFQFCGACGASLAEAVQHAPALLQLLVSLSEEQPIVLILEDLHWSDPSTLELLELIIDQGPTARMLTLLADAYGSTGREGLRLLDKAQAMAEETGEQAWGAELHRLRGELLLRQAQPEDEAEACFREAL